MWLSHTRDIYDHSILFYTTFHHFVHKRYINVSVMVQQPIKLFTILYLLIDDLIVDVLTNLSDACLYNVNWLHEVNSRTICWQPYLAYCQLFWWSARGDTECHGHFKLDLLITGKYTDACVIAYIPLWRRGNNKLSAFPALCGVNPDSRHKGSIIQVLFILHCRWPEQAVDWSIESPVISHAMTLMWRQSNLNVNRLNGNNRGG